MARRRRLGHDGIRAFLDTNVWNAMVGDDESVIEDIKTAHRGGILEIILTVELVEEILAAANRRRDRASAMTSLAKRVGGSRLLKPLNDRLVEEAAIPGAVPVSQRYMPKATMSHLEAILNSRQDVDAVNEAVEATKDQTLGLYSSWANEIMDLVRSRGSKPRDFEARITSESIGALAVPCAADLTNRFGVSAVGDANVGPHTVPSLWYLSACLAARLMRRAREGRKLQPSDHHDCLHCAGGAYFDVFVTDDGELRFAFSLIEALPFETWNLAELKQWLGSRLPA